MQVGLDKHSFSKLQSRALVRGLTVISIASTLSIDKKRDMIDKVLKEFGNPYCDTDNDLYEFTYDKNWWTSEYKIYLSFDMTNFYASVQSATRGYRGGGIIDFGGTKKVRQKLIVYLTNSVHVQ